MLPLNYALLKFFTTVGEADVTAAMAALAPAYAARRPFRRRALAEALMTAAANGVLEETRYDLDASGQLRVFYRLTPSGRALLTRLLPG